jgi:antirestriction protein ArdC
MNEASNRVADALDAGLIPWRLRSGLPRNVVTGKLYGSLNPVLLEIAAGALGCTSPWWGTLKEWQTVGGRVRPDSLGARILNCPEVVYNLEQTDRAHRPSALPEDDPSKVFEAIVRSAKVRIEYVFNATCKYFWDGDYIVMPHPWMFEIGPGKIWGYFDGLGHELHHWSERRVYWKGSPEVNELRAEIGTGYLGALAGAKPLPLHLARHHRKYAARWAALMRSEPDMLVKVCENVTATVSWLFAFAGRTVDWSCPASLNE